MFKNMSRANRRHQRARIKNKRQFHWGYGHKDEWVGRMPEHAGEINYMSPRTAGFVINTPTPCSCLMCCNPRHNGWETKKECLTMQEKKALEDYNDQIEEL